MVERLREILLYPTLTPSLSTGRGTCTEPCVPPQGLSVFEAARDIPVHPCIPSKQHTRRQTQWHCLLTRSLRPEASSALSLTRGGRRGCSLWKL